MDVGRKEAAPKDHMGGADRTADDPSRGRRGALRESEYDDARWRPLRIRLKLASRHSVEVRDVIADLAEAVLLRHPRRTDGTLCRRGHVHADEIKPVQRLGRDDRA